MDDSTAALRGTTVSNRRRSELNTSPSKHDSGISSSTAKKMLAPPSSGAIREDEHEGSVKKEGEEEAKSSSKDVDDENESRQPESKPCEAEAEAEAEAASSSSSTPPSKAVHVVEELFRTEQEYVTDLSDIISGYLRPLSDRLKEVSPPTPTHIHPPISSRTVRLLRRSIACCCVPCTCACAYACERCLTCLCIRKEGVVNWFACAALISSTACFCCSMHYAPCNVDPSQCTSVKCASTR